MVNKISDKLRIAGDEVKGNFDFRDDVDAVPDLPKPEKKGMTWATYVKVCGDYGVEPMSKDLWIKWGGLL